MKKLILMLMLCVPMAMSAQKFGHVDAQSVMQNLPEFMKVRGELEAQAKQYDNDLKLMQDEIQKKVDNYEKSKSTMNATKQQEEEDYTGFASEVPAGTARQPAGFPEGTTGEDAAYNDESDDCHKERRQSRWLCIHHGQRQRHTLYQRHTEQGCYCRCQGGDCKDEIKRYGAWRAVGNKRRHICSCRTSRHAMPYPY